MFFLQPRSQNFFSCLFELKNRNLWIIKIFKKYSALISTGNKKSDFSQSWKNIVKMKYDATQPPSSYFPNKKPEPLTTPVHSGVNPGKFGRLTMFRVQPASLSNGIMKIDLKTRRIQNSTFRTCIFQNKSYNNKHSTTLPALQI